MTGVSAMKTKKKIAVFINQWNWIWNEHAECWESRSNQENTEMKTEN